MGLTEKDHSGTHLISQSLMMYHTKLEHFGFMIMWKIHVLYWHMHVDIGTSAPAISLYKLNSAVQWSQLINLDCRVALFSKMRWPYPGCLLAWYIEVKAAIFPYIFSLVILYAFPLIFLEIFYPLSFSLLKNVKGFGTHETKSLFTSAYEKKAAGLQSSISHSTEWQGWFKI